MHSSIKRVETAISAIQNGEMVIVTDHPDRENEGDLIMPAETITAAQMNFMIRQGTGIVCLSMTAAMLNQLELPLMVESAKNSSFSGTPFTITIDAKEGISTGVSASDRVQTVLAAIADDATAKDIAIPGHIFPLRAREGGVLEREGHTEGSVDLARIAGFKPAAVICEIMNPDGTMTRGKDLELFAEQHDLLLLSIDDIIQYRIHTENLIDEMSSSTLQLEQHGEFDITIVKEKENGREHTILSKPSADTSKPTLVRIHSSCTTGDIFGSKRCDCNKQLHYSLDKISQEGGILIYLSQEGRDVGLFNKIKAYQLQDQGLDTVEANLALGLPADARQYYIAANILRNLNIKNLRLLTNNPNKLKQLVQYGISDVTREPMPVFHNHFNRHYLKTKKEKLNHLFNNELIPVLEETP